MINRPPSLSHPAVASPGAWVTPIFGGLTPPTPPGELCYRLTIANCLGSLLSSLHPCQHQRSSLPPFLKPSHQSSIPPCATQAARRKHHDSQQHPPLVQAATTHSQQPFSAHSPCAPLLAWLAMPELPLSPWCAASTPHNGRSNSSSSHGASRWPSASLRDAPRLPDLLEHFSGTPHPYRHPLPPPRLSLVCRSKPDVELLHCELSPLLLGYCVIFLSFFFCIYVTLVYI